MATIRSQMVLNDQMTGVLRKITNALDFTLHSFEQMQQASGNAVDTKVLNSMRIGLAECNGTIHEIEANYRRATAQGEQLAEVVQKTSYEERRLNQAISAGNDEMDSMLDKAKNIATTIGVGMGIKKLIALSDQMTSTNARLALLVTDNGSVSELEQKIMASAQRSRAAYLDTAAAVASMGANAGNAFDHDMDQVIAFMEQVNKQFVIGGATAQGQSAAMLQLTQAMAAGALRGEELNSILENAPGIARAIEQYMGIAEGSIKEYAQEGKVTAEVVKNALFSVAEETDAKFDNMSRTWGQVWTQWANTALKASQPLLAVVNWLANNISIIGPIVLGVGAAFLVFQIAAHWTQIAAFATAAYHTVVNLLSIGFGVLTGNTAAASAAVFTFNSALLASPITWIIMCVLIVIGLIYAAVAAINHFKGTSVSATGIIAGVFAVLGAHILNSTVIPIQNGFAMVANFLGNVFNNPVAAIKVLFYDMALTVIGYISNMAHAIENVINKIPGVTVDITSGLDSFYAGLEQAQQAVKDESGWVEYVQKMDFIDYGDAAKAGYNFGAGVEDKIGGMFNMGDGSGFDMSSMMGDVGSIAGDAGSIADSLSVTDEELEYLRDIAERDAINRFTTAEVKIDMTGMTNKIDGSADIDGIITELTDGFTEALVTAAEGVHE